MKRWFLWVMICILLAACSMPASAGPGMLAQPPQAWIDAPLDGSTLPLVPYPVVFHGSDPGAVQQGEFSVNGQVQANLPNSDPGSHLVVFRVEWTPPAPGKYTLQVRALNSRNTWSSEVAIHVIVGESTPTPTFLLTPTPTVVPSSTATPTLSAGLAFSNTTTPKQVYVGACTPNQVTFEVTVSQPQTVHAVLVFTRLQDVSSGKQSGWDTGTMLDPQGNGVFRRTIDTSAISGVNGGNAAYLFYQFVAADTGGQITARSPSYNDAVISRCGIIIPPLRPLPLPLQFGTPTATFQVVK